MKRILPALLLAATLSAPAWAQMGAGRPGAPFQPMGGVAKPSRGPTQPAPPALPGARAETTEAAPAERSAADMPPTEALFDAINRGDLPTARDSLNRGADLNATNVLGLTPLDLAIDLGRNEISFLLLSLRGGAGYSAARQPVAPAPPRTPTRAERAEAARAERASRTQATARAAQPNPPQTARLFANNGGTPSPQAGFLGFDGGR